MNLEFLLTYVPSSFRGCSTVIRAADLWRVVSAAAAESHVQYAWIMCRSDCILHQIPVTLDHECIARSVSVFSQTVVCWPQDTSVSQSNSRSLKNIVSLQKVRKQNMDRSTDGSRAGCCALIMT